MADVLFRTFRNQQKGLPQSSELLADTCSLELLYRYLLVPQTVILGHKLRTNGKSCSCKVTGVSRLRSKNAFKKGVFWRKKVRVIGSPPDISLEKVSLLTYSQTHFSHHDTKPLTISKKYEKYVAVTMKGFGSNCL